MPITKPDLSVFTGSEDFGTVFREQNQITVKFFELNIPLTDDTGRVSSNTKGKTRLLIIQGAHDGSNFTGADQNAKLNAFITKMETWVNAAIQTGRTYTDSFGNSYQVDAIDWTWTRSFDDPYRVNYNLLMKRA